MTGYIYRERKGASTLHFIQLKRTVFTALPRTCGSCVVSRLNYSRDIACKQIRPRCRFVSSTFDWEGASAYQRVVPLGSRLGSGSFRFVGYLNVLDMLDVFCSPFLPGRVPGSPAAGFTFICVESKPCPRFETYEDR